MDHMKTMALTTEDELEFVVFCIENLAIKHGKMPVIFTGFFVAALIFCITISFPDMRFYTRRIKNIFWRILRKQWRETGFKYDSIPWLQGSCGKAGCSTMKGASVCESKCNSSANEV